MKKIIRVFTLVLIACILFSSVSFQAASSEAHMYLSDIINDVDLSYKDMIRPYFYPEKFGTEREVFAWYNMLYAEEGEGDTPEYIVFYGLFGAGDDVIIERFVGDVFLMNYISDYPYDLSYYVFVPAHKKVYTIEEAYENNVVDLTNAFNSGRVGIRRGDVNLDGSLDILDATFIQMRLAGIDGYDPKFSMDFDKDHKATIMDATAIQRHLAQL